MCLWVGCNDDGLPGGGTQDGGTAGDLLQPEAPQSCGGKTGQPCAAGWYCDYPNDLCGGNDQPGVCRQNPPGDCAALYAPVCGCDFMTYSNECLARLAGVDTRSQGTCAPTPGTACGGWAGFTCAADEYCDFPPGQMCDYVDGSGVCAKRPQGCNLIYDPVCGCNGQTYPSDCAAHTAGVDDLRKGACK